MAGSDRRARVAPPEALFCYIALLGVVALGYATGRSVGVDAGRSEVTAREHYEREKNRALIACSGAVGPALPDCMEEALEAAQEQSESRQELYAQQDAARWAFWAVFFSALSTAFTAAGVWLVKRTLDATLVAVKDTGEATKAMQQANRIAAKAVRPLILIESARIADGITWTSAGEPSISIELKIRNIGNEAASWLLKHVETVGDHKWMNIAKNAASALAEIEPTDDEPLLVLVPQDCTTWEPTVIHFQREMWKSDPPITSYFCILIIVVVTYRSISDATRRRAIKAYKIGLKNHPEELPELPLILKADDLTISEVPYLADLT